MFEILSFQDILIIWWRCPCCTLLSIMMCFLYSEYVFAEHWRVRRMVAWYTLHIVEILMLCWDYSFLRNLPKALETAWIWLLVSTSRELSNITVLPIYVNCGLALGSPGTGWWRSCVLDIDGKTKFLCLDSETGNNVSSSESATSVARKVVHTTFSTVLSFQTRTKRWK